MPTIRPYQVGQIIDKGSRADDIRRDNDTVTVPKVTLYDIDYAVYYHLTENAKLRIIENSNPIPVPVMFGNGEKWSQIRQHGYLRDNDRKVMAPIVILRRIDFAPDDRIQLAVGQYAGINNVKMIPHKQSSMQYDRVAGQYVSKESYEYYLLDSPEYVRVNYEMIIWTDLQEQMNTIVQTIIPMNGHIWGDFYKFRTVLSSATHDNVNIPGEDRLIKTTIQLQVDGYLRNEYVYQQSSLVKAHSIKRVDFLNETEDEVIFQQISDLTNVTAAPYNISDADYSTDKKSSIRKGF